MATQNMQFEIRDLKKLLYSVKQYKINEVKIVSKKFELIINTSYSIIQSQPITKAKKITNDDTKVQKDSLQIRDTTINTSNNYFTIVSPMVGTFYCAPGPNEPPFIKLYDVVQPKQTVCIIEAMKLMNEIESEVNGEIVEILVQDGDIIDCGQALMKVRPMDK
uniref:acetyl-CoA carboxylase, biotin carboxyl carrier protein n=1 Tax=Catenella fusiformis TaxID=3024791 RepID=UPI0027DA992F|nr:acetyl-CoA carboxylase, biotin carboxyl carrier protein [Catenella fusiformis]WCH57552.1 acetyl-CoA carboxylase, biotin carboxyl carrier protein [Catenella fusiformis]